MNAIREWIRLRPWIWIIVWFLLVIALWAWFIPFSKSIGMQPVPLESETTRE